MAAVFPFFVGCGRSGTTLLRAIFDSHPDLTIPNESRFIPTLASRRHRYEGHEGPAAVHAFVDDLCATPWFEHWGLPEPLVRSTLLSSSWRGFPDAVRALFQLQAKVAGKSRYGDKSPGYVMHLRMLAELFPEARFIHLIRDGRDVALGYQAADFGPDRVGELALHWRLRVARGRRAGQALGPERYREVHYEDLVASSEHLVRELCDFIQLDFDPCMLEYHRRAAAVVQHDRAPQHHRNLFLPPTPGLRDWRTQMEAEDQAVFSLLAGQLLTDLGYQSSPVRPTTRAVRSAAATWTQWQGRRVASRVSWRRLRPSVHA